MHRMEVIIAILAVVVLVWWGVSSERRKSKHLRDFFDPPKKD